MDGDLQNYPVDIGRFFVKIDQGYDIVIGWRFNRQSKLVTRKIPSRIANWLIGKELGRSAAERNRQDTSRTGIKRELAI